MDSIQAIILGIVQGFTEFLPISSSAHLILTPFFFNWEDPGLAYDIALHMGTLLAILTFFWRDWVSILKQLAGKKEGVPLKLIIIGSVPAAVAGLVLKDYAESAFRSPVLVAITLAVFGLALYYFDQRGKKNREIESFTLTDALTVGAAQAIALIPGVSRSGVTITAALMLGMTRSSAARFSFLLSAPITAGAGLVKAKHIMSDLAVGGAMAQNIAIGFAASLISGIAALGLLNYIIKSRSFTGFVAYRLLLSLVIIIVVIFR